jgi:quercetin dioxygenase-like cupin family protein
MTSYRLTPTEQVTVTERSPATLVAEATYAAAGSPPPPHRHPAQDEDFTVLEGELTVTVDQQTRTLHQGETIAIPRGAAHQMWNAHPTSPARVRWATTPALRTEDWWAGLDSSGATPKLLTVAPLLREYRDVFEIAGPPRWVIQPLLAALSVGRRPGGRGRATPARA